MRFSKAFWFGLAVVALVLYECYLSLKSSIDYANRKIDFRNDEFDSLSWRVHYLERKSEKKKKKKDKLDSVDS